MTIVKGNVTYGVETRFGPNWPGQRYLAKKVRVQRAKDLHTSTMDAVGYTGDSQRVQGLQRA